jgi:regulator of cell morphogenesis and NO signaling
MENIKDLSLGQIVTLNYKAADIFDKYKLDFCCKGKRTLTQACAEKQLDADKVASEIEETANSLTERKELFDSWELDFLADYIINHHHAYVKDASEKLLYYTTKVASKHSTRHPELEDIEIAFAAIAAEMEEHMHKEEMILFPYIKALAAAKRNEGSQPKAPFPSVQFPIQMMENEHEAAGELLEQIRQLTNNYNYPVDACNTYKVMYGKLYEFEKDLHQHIHLENNILFPKAIRLEDEMLSSAFSSCSI